LCESPPPVRVVRLLGKNSPILPRFA
jgi:hypothetical protein